MEQRLAVVLFLLFPDADYVEVPMVVIRGTGLSTGQIFSSLPNEDFIQW